MSPEMIGLIGVAAMLIVFLLGVPVTYAMALVGFVGYMLVDNSQAAMAVLGEEMYSKLSDPKLIVIPLFTFMGQLALNAGVSRRLYEMAYRFVGSVRGGLAMATCMASTAFGAVCGSSSATAATMATVGIPEMRHYGYERGFAAGTVAAGGSMGMLMPPSVVLIVYGAMTQESIGALFAAGVIPALVVTGLFMLAVAMVCRIWPDLGPAGENFTWKQKLASLADMAEVIAVFALVMWGMFDRHLNLSPTKAAAIGCLGMVVVGLVRRQLTWTNFRKAVADTLWTSCMTIMLVAGAVVFGQFLTVTGVTSSVVQTVSGLDLPGWAIMGVICLVYLVGGCFIDALALIMLTVNMFVPIVEALGYDRVWFGIIIVLVTQAGVITPPVGLNVYVVHGIDRDTDLNRIFIGALPYLGALIVGAAIMIMFPEVILWLPNLLFD